MIDFIKEFEGVFGAILGVIVTLISTDILRRFGRRTIYASELKMDFIKEENNYGSINELPVNIYNQVDYFNYYYELILYNSSDIPYGLFDLKFEFVGESGNKYYHSPYDDERTESNGYNMKNKKFDTIELDPKKLKYLKLKGQIKKEELDLFLAETEIHKVYLIALNHRNKKFRRKFYSK